MSRTTAEFLADAREHAARGRVYVAGLAGEALKRIPAAMLSVEAGVPWHAAIGARNYLAHNYWQVDGEVLRRIATVDLEPLIVALDRLIAHGESGA